MGFTGWRGRRCAHAIPYPLCGTPSTKSLEVPVADDDLAKRRFEAILRELGLTLQAGELAYVSQYRDGLIHEQADQLGYRAVRRGHIEGRSCESPRASSRDPRRPFEGADGDWAGDDVEGRRADGLQGGGVKAQTSYSCSRGGNKLLRGPSPAQSSSLFPTLPRSQMNRLYKDAPLRYECRHLNVKRFGADFRAKRCALVHQRILRCGQRIRMPPYKNFAELKPASFS